MSSRAQWERFKRYCIHYPALGLSLDVSRMHFDEEFLERMEPSMRNAFDEMEQLEAGAIANADEGRMVGHYWLRNPGMAPNAGITREITEMNTAVITFSKSIHEGRVRGAWGAFENALVIGIGGSALGPQLVARAMARPGKEQLKMYFLDNTDPDGIDLLLAELKGKLGRTLTVVISKSGGTKETRNGMVEVKRAYEQADLKFEQHAVAVTGLGSELDKVATNGGWIRRFPMWDWVGGRYSFVYFFNVSRYKSKFRTVFFC